MSKQELMSKIRSLSFAKCETELFLDTHPDCREALDYFRDLCYRLKMATEEYEESYGPLTSSASSGERWSWVDTPWPWQIEDNMDAGIIKGGRAK